MLTLENLVGLAKGWHWQRRRHRCTGSSGLESRPVQAHVSGPEGLLPDSSQGSPGLVQGDSKETACRRRGVCVRAQTRASAGNKPGPAHLPVS